MKQNHWVQSSKPYTYTLKLSMPELDVVIYLLSKQQLSQNKITSTMQLKFHRVYLGILGIGFARFIYVVAAVVVFFFW